MYTFWDYRRNRWERDAGLRIDHLLLNRKAAKRLVDAGVDRHVRGIENASDHAPVWITLRDAKVARRNSVRRAEKKVRPATRKWSKGPEPVQRPLLVIDGDSFAHRSYHALPKTIMRRGTSRPARSSALPICCCVFTARRSRAPCLLAGTRWRRRPTAIRHFPAYQGGREFDDALDEQLNVLPEFVAACGFQNAMAGRFRGR
jgi:hypothetical protein